MLLERQSTNQSIIMWWEDYVNEFEINGGGVFLICRFCLVVPSFTACLLSLVVRPMDEMLLLLHVCLDFKDKNVTHIVNGWPVHERKAVDYFLFRKEESKCWQGGGVWLLMFLSVKFQLPASFLVGIILRYPLIELRKRNRGRLVLKNVKAADRIEVLLANDEVGTYKCTTKRRLYFERKWCTSACISFPFVVIVKSAFCCLVPTSSLANNTFEPISHCKIL